ncbi:uncharacterized [Lates japonicus]
MLPVNRKSQKPFQIAKYKSVSGAVNPTRLPPKHGSVDPSWDSRPVFLDEFGEARVHPSLALIIPEAERRGPAHLGVHQRERNLHELQQNEFTSAGEGEDYISFAMVDFDEPQWCCVTPHLQSCLKGLFHILSLHIRSVFGNPACQ